MKLEELAEAVQTTDAPTKAQLDRVMCFAVCAWGAETRIRYGFRFTRGGVLVYVHQDGRHGSKIACEGRDLAAVLRRLENVLVARAVENGAIEARVRGIVDKVVPP